MNLTSLTVNFHPSQVKHSIKRVCAGIDSILLRANSENYSILLRQRIVSQLLLFANSPQEDEAYPKSLETTATLKRDSSS
jgi:hypothetical protein